MTRCIVYYVSGHGFGHARRSAEVVRALLAADPDVRIHIRTTAPAGVFEDLPEDRVELHSAGLDPGVVEDDALTVSAARTLEAVRQSLEEAGPRIEAEARFVRQAGASLVLSDIAFLAGDVAEMAGIPCLAVSNFTWDWIYEPFLAHQPEGGALLERIRASYGRMAGILRLPFGGVAGSFPKLEEVPLIATVSRRPREEVLERLGLAKDNRPRVLVGLRGGIEAQVLGAAASQADEMVFLCPHRVGGALPGNLRIVELGASLSYADLVSVSDAVVSKLGYGTISDCIAVGTALLWPERTGFREDDVTRVEAARYLRMRQISREKFFAGEWADYLRMLLVLPAAEETTRTDGAAIAAEIIANWR